MTTCIAAVYQLDCIQHNKTDPLPHLCDKILREWRLRSNVAKGAKVAQVVIANKTTHAVYWVGYSLYYVQLSVRINPFTADPIKALHFAILV